MSVVNPSQISFQAVPDKAVALCGTCQVEHVVGQPCHGVSQGEDTAYNKAPNGITYSNRSGITPDVQFTKKVGRPFNLLCCGKIVFTQFTKQRPITVLVDSPVDGFPSIVCKCNEKVESKREIFGPFKPIEQVELSLDDYRTWSDR